MNCPWAKYKHGLWGSGGGKGGSHLVVIPLEIQLQHEKVSPIKIETYSWKYSIWMTSTLAERLPDVCEMMCIDYGA